MQAIVSNETYTACAPGKCFSHDDLESMGRLCFVQLAELRHSGAFSTVAHAFAACCAACRKSSELPIRGLPDIWYKVSLDDSCQV